MPEKEHSPTVDFGKLIDLAPSPPPSGGGLFRPILMDCRGDS
jgi:hypothetical protein